MTVELNAIYCPADQTRQCMYSNENRAWYCYYSVSISHRHWKVPLSGDWKVAVSFAEVKCNDVCGSGWAVCE